MEERNDIVEIREDVRNYILSEIKLSLSRLGIATNLKEVKEDNIYYKSMKKNDVIAVSLDYSYEHFGGGHNGCSLGTMTFFVRKDIPEVFDDCLGIEFYIRKVRGLEI